MKPKNTLSDERLIELIETFGADIERWPEDLADRARDALGGPSEAVATALAAEAELDALLSVTPEIDPPEHLYTDILASAPVGKAQKGGQVVNWLSAGWGRRLAAAATALTMGLSIGLGTAAASAPADDPFYEAETFGFDATAFNSAIEEDGE